MRFCALRFGLHGLRCASVCTGTRTPLCSTSTIRSASAVAESCPVPSANNKPLPWLPSNHHAPSSSYPALPAPTSSRPSAVRRHHRNGHRPHWFGTRRLAEAGSISADHTIGIVAPPLSTVIPPFDHSAAVAAVVEMTHQAITSYE